jgi:hypothetical protein
MKPPQPLLQAVPALIARMALLPHPNRALPNNYAVDPRLSVASLKFDSMFTAYRL